MNENTTVYIWSGKSRSFVPTKAVNAKCPECGEKYSNMVWDTVIINEPHLQCDCGEQFHTKPE